MKNFRDFYVPSKTPKQAKFMRAVANNPKFAKEVGVAQSVGKDFEDADEAIKKRPVKKQMKKRYKS